MSDKDNIISGINNIASDTRNDPSLWKDKELANKKKRTTIKGKVGVGFSAVTPNSGGGGSISTPLTEQSRTYHADKIATSSDGLFTFHYANVNEINFTDANSSPVKLIFSNP